MTQSQRETGEGHFITITATPNEHWQFIGWSGDFSGSNQPTVNVFMDRDRTVTALFEKVEYPVTIDITGEGDVLTEIVSQKSITEDFPHATVLQLTAEPATGWEFLSWGGAAEGNDTVTTVEVDGPVEVTATFGRIDYKLIVTVEGGGQVEQQILPTTTTETEYPFETMVQLTAVANFGWEFDRWEGGASGTDPVVIVDMLEQTEITAFFKRQNFTLEIQITGDGNVQKRLNGVITTSTEFPFESEVELTALPASGWLFSGWGGDVTEDTERASVTVMRNKEIVARFSPNVTVSTNQITSITPFGAVSGGSVSNQSNVTIIDQGLCWSTSPDPNPDTNPDLNCESAGTDTDSFSISMTGLSPSTTYYVRAVAGYSFQNSPLLVLGNQREFTTLDPPSPPGIRTDQISNITQTSASASGSVLSDGGAEVTSRGICYGIEANPDSNNGSCINSGSGTGAFTASISGLTAATTYYARAFATNSAGTAFGETISFTTLEAPQIELPQVTTTQPTSITATSAQAGGTVISDGGATITNRGVCIGTSPNPASNCTSDGTGTGSFSSTLSGLTASTTYYIRAFASNSAGTAFGNEVSFTTSSSFASLPVLSTIQPSSITQNSAVSGGNITSDGGAEITNRGVCIGSAPNPTANCTSNGTGTGSFSSTLSGLTASTTYYIRAFATNSSGTAYGNEHTFTTASAPTSGTQVGLVFIDGVNFDVTLNGTLIPASRGFDYTFGSAGVKVVNLSGNIQSMALNPDQVKVSGLNNEGFGAFGYKMVNKNSDANLYAINANDNGNPEFWGQPASTNPLGVINNRSGDTVYGTNYPDSLFYLGWRFDPVNQPNNRTFQSQWSDTGKMVITFINYGQNHGSPAVP